MPTRRTREAILQPRDRGKALRSAGIVRWRTIDQRHLHFDAFHAAKIAGDVLGTWAAMRDIAAHVQVAQMPDRSEPDQGEIDYPAFFADLDAGGYAGWVAGEYKPRKTTREGLGWISG